MKRWKNAGEGDFSLVLRSRGIYMAALVMILVLGALLPAAGIRAESMGQADWNDPEYVLRARRAAGADSRLAEWYGYGETPEESVPEEGLSSSKLSMADPYTGRVYDHGNRLEDSTLRYGVDVSKWQEDIDWEKVKDSGISFAFVRIAYTKRAEKEFTACTDELAEEHLAGARAAGLDVGVYYFSQAVTPEEAVREAEYALEFLDARPLDLPVVFDYETDTGYRNYDLNKEEGTAICEAFCERILEAGYQPCVYGNQYCMTEKVDAKRLDQKYPIWIARYNSYVYPQTFTGYIPRYTFWQYAASDVSGDRVPGIGASDLDFWYYTEDLSSCPEPEIRSPEEPAMESPVLKQPENGDEGVELSWNAVPECSRYGVLRRTGGGRWKLLGETEKTDWVDTQVCSGVDYRYAVCCLSGEGGEILSAFDEEGLAIRFLSILPAEEVTLENKADHVQLTWKQVPGAEGYYVYRKVPGGRYAKIGTRKGMENTSFPDMNVTGGASYVYAVRAYCGTVRNAFADLPWQYLGAVTGEDLKVSNKMAGVQLTWKEIPGAQSYLIYRKPASGSWVKLATVPGTTLKYLDEKAGSGASVYYAVRACTDGRRGDYEAKKHMWLAGIFPSDIALTCRTEGMNIQWKKVPGAQGYKVYRRTGTGYVLLATVKGETSLSWTDTGAVSGSDYTCTVKAYRDSFAGAYQDKSGYYLGPVSASDLTLTNNSKGVKLSWKAVKGAEGYRIYRKTAGVAYKCIARVGGGSTVTYTDTAAVNGTAYAYAVRAYRGSLLGYYGGVVTIRLNGVTLSGVAASGKGGLKVTLSGKNAKALGYQIQYSTGSGFTSGNKTVNITDPSTLTKTITGLTRGRKYYVRVRAYGKFSGKYYYSGWSTVRSGTTK